MALKPIESSAETIPGTEIVRESRQNVKWIGVKEKLERNNPNKAGDLLNSLKWIDPDANEKGKTDILLRILEKYSDHTASHSRGIRRIFEKFEKIKDLPGLELFRDIDFPTFAVAMERHDIGKIGMPEEILNEPDITYGPEEIRIKETHPLVGHLILRNLKFNEKSVRLALTHHLKYKTLPDGSVDFADYPVQAFKDYCDETKQKYELTAEDQLAAFADVFSALMDTSRMTDRFGTHGIKNVFERCKDSLKKMDDKIFNDKYYQEGAGAPLYSALKKAMSEPEMIALFEILYPFIEKSEKPKAA
jgi:hypothetical protein